MKVILKESISGVGVPGKVVTVSDGFARNYLFPQKKAIPATAENLKNIEKYSQNLNKKIEARRKEAETFAQTLSGLQCVIEKKIGKNNKIFGSVTSQDISNALGKLGTKIDKKDILLEAPIRETGEFEVPIRLYSDLKGSIKVTIKAS